METNSANPSILGYHAHVYFDAGSIETARRICIECRDRLGVELGRMHEKPVGPHPFWSCQLSFKPDTMADVVGWLALHREGLTVLVHPDTGHEMADHTDHAIWMGDIAPLNVSIFNDA